MDNWPSIVREQVEQLNYQRIIDELWPELRKKHLYPAIPKPKVAFLPKHSALQMKDKQIKVSKDFCTKLAEKMELAQVLEALLDHELAHHSFCPFDLTTHLLIYASAKEVLGNHEKAAKAADCFMDIAANTYCVMQMETAIPELYRNMEKSELERAICSLYQELWRIDLGVEEHIITKKLASVNYTNKAMWEAESKRFARYIRELLHFDANPMLAHGFERYSKAEIESSLRDFAKRIEDPKKFGEIVRDLQNLMVDAEAEKQAEENGSKIPLYYKYIEKKTLMGRGIGSLIDANVLFYQKLAENYIIPVQKLPLEKDGSLYPYSLSEWEVERPIQDINYWGSFGKLLPGITKLWRKAEGETHGSLGGIPDCLIVIDSSGSMTNPRETLSHAVLGSFCAANAYLENRARIAVYNYSDAFGGNDIILDYTRDRKQIYETLCKYFGGGTAINLNKIEALRNKANKPDIFMISDIAITNLPSVIEYFSRIENRTTLVYLGLNVYAEELIEKIGLKENISLFNVEKSEDIPKIVLGKVESYITKIAKLPEITRKDFYEQLDREITDAWKT
ncbi:MAG: hypothetical protein QXL78_04340 [Methanocellales archaeon]